MKDYTQLSRRERQQVAAFLSMGYSIATIANRLARHRSTIYREISRHDCEGDYFPVQAHQKAIKQHTHPPSKVDCHPVIYQYIYHGLQCGWSPEQIAGRMKREKLPVTVCPETIYRYIDHHPELQWHLLLPRQCRRRSRKKEKAYHSAPAKGFRNIQYRPASVLSRRYFGHWEGDTILFSACGRYCVTTLIERKTRFVFLCKNENKTSSVVIDQIKYLMLQTGFDLWHTITFDLGAEFSSFTRLEEGNDCQVYFCDPYSPWQRPTNENTNGRLRRFLPRKTRMDQITQDDLDKIALRLNSTPRKCLNFLTPAEVFMHYAP